MLFIKTASCSAALCRSIVANRRAKCTCSTSVFLEKCKCCLRSCPLSCIFATVLCFVFYNLLIILSIKCQETVKKIKIKCSVINPFRYIPSYKKHIFVFFLWGGRRLLGGDSRSAVNTTWTWYISSESWDPEYYFWIHFSTLCQELINLWINILFSLGSYSNNKSF